MDGFNWDPLDDVSDEARKRLEAFQSLLLQFNRKVNLISADSESAFENEHVRHCLTLLHRRFPDGAQIVDWGTGGGLPAIPLAITNPEATVYAVDSVGKKVRIVRTMARRLGLENCFPWHGRAEAWEGEAHYSVSRATAPLAELWSWHRRVVVPWEGEPWEGEPDLRDADDFWTPGLLCLKGGDLTEETADLRDTDPAVSVERVELGSLLGRDDHFWAEKKLVAVTRDADAAP